MPRFFCFKKSIIYFKCSVKTSSICSNNKNSHPNKHRAQITNKIRRVNQIQVPRNSNEYINVYNLYIKNRSGSKWRDTNPGHKQKCRKRTIAKK